MSKPRLNSGSVVTAAASVIDREGPEGLTLAGLAGDLGVRPPSLYTHVSSLDDLKQRVADSGIASLTDALKDAALGRSGKEALRSLSSAYRQFAKNHRGAYGLMLGAGGESVLRCITKALSPDGTDEEQDAAVHIVLSGLHGFVSLELAGLFASDPDADRSFDRLVKLLWKAMP